MGASIARPYMTTCRVCINKFFRSDFLDAVRPNTALMEILKTMRAAGHDLACVTTGSKQNATEVLEHFGVRKITDALLKLQQK